MATQLEELYLGGGCDEGDCDMTNQIGTIIDAIASDEVATLKKLTLHYIDLSLVDGHLLGRMATKVKELNIRTFECDESVFQDDSKCHFGHPFGTTCGE